MNSRRNPYHGPQNQAQDEEDARLAYMLQSLHDGLRRALNCCRDAYLIVDEFTYLADALKCRIAAKTASRLAERHATTTLDEPADRIPF